VDNAHDASNGTFATIRASSRPGSRESRASISRCICNGFDPIATFGAGRRAVRSRVRRRASRDAKKIRAKRPESRPIASPKRARSPIASDVGALRARIASSRGTSFVDAASTPHRRRIATTNSLARRDRRRNLRDRRREPVADSMRIVRTNARRPFARVARRENSPRCARRVLRRSSLTRPHAVALLPGFACQWEIRWRGMKIRRASPGPGRPEEL